MAHEAWNGAYLLHEDFRVTVTVFFQGQLALAAEYGKETRQENDSKTICLCLQNQTFCQPRFYCWKMNGEALAWFIITKER